MTQPQFVSHRLDYVDGATRCTVCGKLGVDCVMVGDRNCLGRRVVPQAVAEMVELTDAESKRVWNNTRDLSRG